MNPYYKGEKVSKGGADYTYSWCEGVIKHMPAKHRRSFWNVYNSKNPWRDKKEINTWVETVTERDK